MAFEAATGSEGIHVWTSNAEDSVQASEPCCFIRESGERVWR